MDIRNPRTKDGAVAFVSAVIRDANALYSDDFVTAMDLSQRFDISVADVLEFRRRRLYDLDRRLTAQAEKR